MMPASSTMSKESASYDMAEFDQSAIFLYLDGHDQEQRQTLNIFPSQPMHVAEPIPAKGGVSMGMVAAMLPNGNSSPKRQEQGGQRSAPPPATTVALPNSSKETRSSLTKKEATSGGKGATSGDQERVRDPKTQRRLAQNREAARKSRLRKKAYIQQLETSRIRLSQLEQQVQVARVQGVFMGNVEQPGFPSVPSPAAVFDMEYGRWVDEHSKLMFQLRAALNEHLGDEQLQGFVNGAMAQHEELLNLKGAMARADVFHLLSGLWASPAERCFLWLGGFRPSEVIKVMLKHVEPLSESQILGIYNLQQTVQEREEALNHSMEATQQNISDIVAAPDVAPATFMGHMSLAMNKVASMEGFVMQILDSWWNTKIIKLEIWNKHEPVSRHASRGTRTRRDEGCGWHGSSAGERIVAAAREAGFTSTRGGEAVPFSRALRRCRGRRWAPWSSVVPSRRSCPRRRRTWTR